MIRIIEFMIALAIVAVLFVVIGLFLPAQRHIVESIETNRKMTLVYDALNGLHHFKSWNALPLRDPALELSFSGPDFGVGSKLDYRSSQPALGQGHWEITSSEENRSITLTISDSARGHDKVVRFELEPTGKNDRNVKITQHYSVDYGFDLLGRYAGLYVGRHVGDDMKLGLTRIANMLTAIPNIDYRAPETSLTDLKVVDVPAENLLIVNAGSVERTNDSIRKSIQDNQEWIKRVMEKNELEAAGPVRIITTQFAPEHYLFDIAQPVRSKAAASTPPTENSNDDSEDEEANVPADEGELTITIPEDNPTVYERTEAHRSAFAAYSGHMAGLDIARSAVRAWAATHAEEVSGRPYESWSGGVDEAFTQEGQYEVYWPLK